MITHRSRQRQSPQPPTPWRDDAPLTLTEEHTLLVGQIAMRAEDLLAVAAEDRWPGQELQALLGYLRAEVMRQISDEELLLFPARPSSPGFVRLGRDHLRLRHCIEALTEAAAAEPRWSLARLATTTRDLLTLLERHLAAEEALLATIDAPRPVPSAAALTGRPHDWYPLTEGPVVDLDALPRGQTVDAAVERILRLRTGERVEIRSSDAGLEDVWRTMDRLAPGGYGFVYLDKDPEQQAVQVTKRPAA